MEKYGIGQPVRRREDVRFLTGRGTYVDDVRPAGAAVGVVLRSPHAHAEIRSIDSTAARAAPGVLAVYTEADLAADGIGPIRTRALQKGRDGAIALRPERPALARDRVRHVGDPVAFVVAETLAQARDAAELVEVDYAPLPAVTDAAAALKPGAPRLYDDVSGNLCFDYEAGDEKATDEAFRGAAHVVAVDLYNNRVAAAPMEPRAAVGEFDAASGRFTITATTQNVHVNRDQLAKEVFKVAPDQIRVIGPDVGGSFGAKNNLYPEYALVLYAARKLGRPVRWTNDRGESFVSDSDGRDNRFLAELALAADGTFLGHRVRSIGNAGAYNQLMGANVASWGVSRMLGGVYRIPAIHFRSRIAFTNTVPTGAYRGAGRPEAAYVIERLVDVAARRLGLDPIELRRKNLVRADEMPFRTAVGQEFDCGDFGAVLARALDLADWKGFAARRAESRAAGRRRGIGLCLYVECSGGQPHEYAALDFRKDGTVLLSVGTHSTGMGHETAFSQMVAARLGIPIERVEFRQGDTDATPTSGGHGGSRSIEVGGTAVKRVADRVVEKAADIASHLLETSAADLDFADGRFTVVGTDRSVTMAEVIGASFDAARLPPGTEPGALDERLKHTRDRHTYPNGCHVAEVEIDPDTGVVKLVAFAVVDDFGTVVNPLLADGQVMGGTAQGIGQALLEGVVFDPDSGQPVTGSLMDYCLPRADDLPSFRLAYFEGAPAPGNPLGAKGSGEAGCCGAPAAVVNAVVNALADLGVEHVDMPLTPERVWRVLRANGA